MHENLLVDSSFLIHQLRQRLDPFKILAASDEDWEFYTSGVVVVEVCRGIRMESAMVKFRETFSILPCVPLTGKVWELASDLAWKLDRQGTPMQVTGLLIAASALSIDAALLTLDTDFNRVPGLTVLNQLD